MSIGPTVVIVNPQSQGGRLGRRWPALSARLKRALPFEERATSAPGDATRLAREALRGGAVRVIAVGGDGTVNEVVNGFFDEQGAPLAPEATFGLIPSGTGGDFRRTLEIPAAPEEAAALIASGARRRIDLGRLEFTDRAGRPAVRLFANIASFGVSGVVDRMMSGSRKRLGRLSFALATARATWSFENRRVALTLDGSERLEARISTVAVANGRFFGGAMRIAPGAEPDDGLFDVVSLGDFGFADLLLRGWRIYRGSHLGQAKVTHRRARVVEAAALEPGAVLELDVDGEPLGQLPARFSILPRALWLHARRT